MSPADCDPLTRSDVTISIGPDGRLYFHDLDPELIAVALAVNPTDPLMRRRLTLCQGPAEEEPAATSSPGAESAESERRQ